MGTYFFAPAALYPFTLSTFPLLGLQMKILCSFMLGDFPETFSSVFQHASLILIVKGILSAKAQSLTMNGYKFAHSKLFQS